jgi:hypothetical protein
MALAGSTISDPTDATGFYENPALSAFISSPALSANSTISGNGLKFLSSAAMPVSLGASQYAALGIADYFMGNFQFQNVTLGYAAKVTSTVSIGIALDLIKASVPTTTDWGYGTSLGVMYYPSPGISYALVYRGAGTNIQYSYQYAEILEQKHPNQSIVAGTTFWFPSMYRRSVVCISLSAEKFFNQSSFDSHAGIEALPYSFFALRFGIHATPHIASGMGGIGFIIHRYRLDYGFSPSTVDKRLHQVSLTIPL